MKTGVVKAYISERGFGFLKVAGEDDLFFHISQVIGLVAEGDSVEFQKGVNDRSGRPCAVKVRRID